MDHRHSAGANSQSSVSRQETWVMDHLEAEGLVEMLAKQGPIVAKLD
jgi:hypothetical protein